MRLFRRLYRYPDTLQVVDGGTLGIGLVAWLGSVPAAVILDAAIGPGSPGTVLDLPCRRLARTRWPRLSAHEVGLDDVVALATWCGRLPRRLRVVGIVAARLAPGVGLSEPVRQALPQALDVTSRWLRRWGVAVWRKDGPPE